MSAGFAGALAPAHIGDVLIGTHVVAHPQELDLPGNHEPVQCDRSCQDRARNLATQLGIGAVIGPIVTVPRVCHTASQKRVLRDNTGAVGVDMESAVIGRMAVAHHVPFSVVRTVSDLLEEDLPLDFNEFHSTWGWIRGTMKAISCPRAWRDLDRFRRQVHSAGAHLSRFYSKFF